MEKHRKEHGRRLVSYHTVVLAFHSLGEQENYAHLLLRCYSAFNPHNGVAARPMRIEPVVDKLLQRIMKNERENEKPEKPMLSQQRRPTFEASRRRVSHSLPTFILVSYVSDSISSYSVPARAT